MFDLFLQLFDEGRLTDSHGRVADARQAIFIMTSNLGTVHRQQGALGFVATSPAHDIYEDEALDEALRARFRPEFLNRIDHIIRFRALQTDDLVEIADLELQALARRLRERNIHLVYERGVAEVIALAALETDGAAREIKRVVEKMISAPISDLLIAEASPGEGRLHLRPRGGQIRVEWQ